MKIRKIERLITPLQVFPSDIIQLTYVDKRGYKHPLLDTTVDRAMVIDEAVIFDIEPSDFPGAVTGIGGAVLGTGAVHNIVQA